MLLPKHRKSIRCEVDRSCSTEATPQLILLYARQVLRKESDIDEKGEDSRSADVYVNTGDPIEVRKYLSVWKVSEGLSSM